MKTVCSPGQCAGCMACADICPHGAVSVQVTSERCIPEINPELCTDCGLCRRVCQNHTHPALEKPRQWLEGWASDPEIRKAGSSGGIAGALTRAFLKNGGAVCSCTYENGSFCFRIARTEAQASTFAGSRYVKSNPQGVWKQIKALLKAGTKVLLIALPCQVAAAKLYMGSLGENLYTADLICHGSPSPQVLEVFLKQHGLRLHQPQFRKKQCYCLCDGAKSISPQGVRDRYSIAFLNSLIHTENCYSCPYAREERAGDLTLGDSWGTEFSAEEAAKGISLVLCQSEKGRQLLELAQLQLFPADREQALAHNHQLCHPSAMPEERTDFFEKLNRGEAFDKLVSGVYPKQCFRQDIKGLLAKLGLRRR